MAAITICSDFGAQKIKSDTVSASIWHEVMGQGGGREDQPHVQGAVAARGAGGPRRSYPTLKVRKKGGEEIPLVQGKEQRLHFAGAAVKR